jgi:hypothetical protein
MKSQPKDFGMFTSEGDRVIGLVVAVAKEYNWDWPKVYSVLSALASADPDGLGEATDTAVREYVYDACGFETPFYI